MRCGQPAECDISQTFAWTPSWVMILIFMGLGPWLIVSIMLRRTMRVVVPMCMQHAGHWRNRQLYVWLGLLFWIAYFIALIVGGEHLPEVVKIPVIVFGLCGGLVWLVSAAIYSNNAIKASEIRDKGIELVNVNRDFADEWRDIAG
jgi:hypothetical protein